MSHELLYSFVNDLHDLCLHVLWKFHEERVWRKREEVFAHLDKQRDNQLSIFLGHLDTDTKKNS
jgi:hypothetical protein